MAAPEEQDLTQEQTEKLLQFQVAASSRCSKGRRGMGSGALEERTITLRLGLGPFSERRAAPSPQTPTARISPAPELCRYPAFQPPLPARLDRGGSAAIVSLSGAGPQPLPAWLTRQTLSAHRDPKSPAQSRRRLAGLDRRPPSGAIHRRLPTVSWLLDLVLRAVIGKEAPTHRLGTCPRKWEDATCGKQGNIESRRWLLTGFVTFGFLLNC